MSDDDRDPERSDDTGNGSADRDPRLPGDTDAERDAHAVAQRQLRQFGLSTYAARTYTTLVVLGSGTATDVSSVAEVPRTRVYDAAEELQEAGLVDVKYASPREFHPVSAETAVRRFERDLADRTASLSSALGSLEPDRRREREHGVWSVRGREAVTERVREFLSGAESEIVFATVDELLTEPILAELRDAAERGVSIRFAGLSASVEERITTAVPRAEPFESVWAWSDTVAGRLLMVDGRETLVSVLADGDRGELDGDVDGDVIDPNASPDETAIWGSGDRNSLVVVLRAVFTWRLDETDED